MDPSRTAPGFSRSTSSQRESAPGRFDSPDPKGEFRLRVHDHDDHIFESPAALPQKPQPFNPKKHRYLPIAVPLLMVGNIAVFILVMYWNNCPNSISPPRRCVGEWLKPLSFQPWAENPMLGPRAAALLKWGALESTLVTHDGQAWRLVSAIAVNGGVLHLCFNLIVLLTVGTVMEFSFSFPRVALVYLIAGFAGSVLSALFVQMQVFAGAGGAICGLIGASLADLAMNWVVKERRIVKLVVLVLFFLISAGFGLMPQVDNFANAGGFAAGFLLGLVLLKRPQRGYKDTRHLSQLEAFIVNNEDPDLPPVKMYKISQLVVSWLALLILVALLSAATVILLLNKFRVNEGCSWCHYAACVPNLKWECPGIYASP